MYHARLALAAALGTALLAATPAVADQVHGTIRYKNVTKNVQHAYFVRGPNALDPTKIIRRLIFTPSDIGAKLQSCATMSCTEGKVIDGMTVDLDAGPRLNYWLALKDGMVQFSGTEKPDALTLTTAEPGKLAGTLKFDGTPQGGPIVDIQFTAALLKEFTAGH